MTKTTCETEILLKSAATESKPSAHDDSKTVQVAAVEQERHVEARQFLAALYLGLPFSQSALNAKRIIRSAILFEWDRTKLNLAS